jgi:2'-5' RNA ligase
LFVGIDVGDEVRAAALASRRVIEDRLSRIYEGPPRMLWTAPEGLHVTLRFFGEQPDARADALVGDAAKPYPLKPFLVKWRGLGAFPSPRRPQVLWLGVTAGAAELGALEAAVARRFAATGAADGAAPRPFHPHVTLGRVKVTGRPPDWSALLEAAAMPPVTSLVDHVRLYRSRGRPGGTGYEVLARGRLEG